MTKGFDNWFGTQDLNNAVLQIFCFYIYKIKNTINLIRKILSK